MNPWISKISPWTAQPLTTAAKDAKLRQALSLHAERVIYGQQAILVSWIVFGLGVAMILTSIGGWVMVLPLKTIQNEIWVADKTTGIIAKPISVEDAPKHFGQAIEEHYVRQYLLARTRWTPETDQEDDHLAKIMSSADEQARINYERQNPNSDVIAIGNAGHVQIENDHYFPQFVDKDSDTRRYMIRFTRTVWRGNNKESSEPWTANVDFQFHPERKMNPADRRDNTPGFVAITFSAKSDRPDPRRQ